MKKVIFGLILILLVPFFILKTATVNAATPCQADINQDGSVNLSDYSILVQNFLLATPTNARADINSDAKVNLIDYAELSGQFMKSCISASPTPTAIPDPTATPTPQPTQLPTSEYLWISPQESQLLPIGDCATQSAQFPAWCIIINEASSSDLTPDLGDQDDKVDTSTVAKALVCQRTGQASYCNDVVLTLKNLVNEHPINNSEQWDWLGVLRSMGSYAIAADIINLQQLDPTFDTNTWRPWLQQVRNAVAEDGRGSIVSAQEKRPNNFGTHASASRVAIALYLDDQADLDRAVGVFKGYLGDRNAYSDISSPGFDYGELTWQANQSAPVGINPKNATLNGHDVDGVLAEELRRCSTIIIWPPCKSDYLWEGLQGVMVTSELLHRAGYPAYQWQDQALLRSVDWLYTTTFNDGNTFPAVGDDRWSIWLINKRYGTTYPVTAGVGPGKMMGFTDWTMQ